MQESTKTICFVVTAAVLGLAAVGNAVMNQPGESEAGKLVGTPFYPEFTSTEVARSLEVSAIDPETGALKRFGVESDGDLWRIPTHFNYPAEGAARIAQTSASVLGLERQALAGMGESEFEKFGVVDPLSEDLEDPESAGKRITLKDENGDPLVDYIIGNEIEDAVPTRGGDDFDIQTEAKEFYMRRADDSQTFRVSLDIDLSTKFSDWIDPDLLRINRPDVTQISINNYKIEERGAGPFGAPELFKDQGDQLKLSRPSAAEQWTMEGISEITEAVEPDRVNEILGVLDEMQIVGVRPKFKFEGKQILTSDLKLADIPEMKADKQKAGRAIQALQRDLMDKGFNFGGTQQNLELVSENGELEFGTSKGLRYRLHIGEAVADEDDTIEIGSKEKDESTTDPEDPAAESEESTDDANRFLFVRVNFDETLLGDRPTEPKLPEPPVKPEGYEPAKVEEKKKESATVDDEADEKGADDADADAESEEEKPAQRNPEFIAYEEALKAVEKAKLEHEMNLTRFKQENEAFDEKIEEGKKLVDELNQRFGDWFYVISASNLKTLQSKREDVVKPVVLPGDKGPAIPSPELSFPSMPKGEATFETPKELAEQKEEVKPEMKESESTEEKPDAEKPETSVEEAPKKEVDEKQADTDADAKKEEPKKEEPKAEPKKEEAAESDKPATTTETGSPEKETAADSKEGDSQ